LPPSVQQRSAQTSRLQYPRNPLHDARPPSDC
jgi:hypothetical protein